MNRDKGVSNWLLICSMCIIIMVLLGGITRLTHAGLSITEWNPISGAIPPLTKTDWVIEKDKYEQTPEFKKINYYISMSEFKTIYLIEYFHRLFGRIIGIIVLIPWIYFTLKKRIDYKQSMKLFLIFILGGIQALVGWIMVKSGLISDPYVNHFKLSIHLMMSLIIFVLLFWQYLQSNKNTIFHNLNHLSYCIIILGTLTVIQIFFGGLVAGLKAGYSYNTFPLMDGELIPDGLFDLQPLLINFLNNNIAVQFAHRVFGISILLVSLICVTVNYYSKYKINTIYWVFIIATLQTTIGILTLIYVVPIPLASLHQGLAFILVAILMKAFHKSLNRKNYI